MRPLNVFSGLVGGIVVLTLIGAFAGKAFSDTDLLNPTTNAAQADAAKTNTDLASYQQREAARTQAELLEIQMELDARQSWHYHRSNLATSHPTGHNAATEHKGAA